MDSPWHRGTLLALFLHALSLFPQQAEAERQFRSHGAASGGLKRRKDGGGCSLYRGTWVPDSSYPFYNSSDCPFIDPEFDCVGYGRPDSQFLRYSWKPASCDLPRFDGGRFVQRWRGKRIMMVGDSLSLNMWESLACMIHASLPKTKYALSRASPVSSVNFQEYGLTVYFYRTPYIVEIVRDQKYGRVLKLDSIQAAAGSLWKGMDMLVFNSWHWWLHKGNSREWDYVQDGSNIAKSMDPLKAYGKGMSTWARWVDDNVDASKTKVLFQGISPTHYIGKEWNEPGSSCKGQAQPIPGSTYPAGSHPAEGVLRGVLSGMKVQVHLLDITLLSQLRRDAHPSVYSGGHLGSNDCSHWCLPGLPDTWNQLLGAATLAMG